MAVVYDLLTVMIMLIDEMLEGIDGVDFLELASWRKKKLMWKMIVEMLVVLQQQ